MNLVELYKDSTIVGKLADALAAPQARLHADGLSGSLPAVLIAAMAQRLATSNQIVIAPSKEEAYYLAGDLEALLSDELTESVDDASKLSTLHFPFSHVVPQGVQLRRRADRQQQCADAWRDGEGSRCRRTLRGGDLPRGAVGKGGGPRRAG